jgi:hypothetical protein
VASERRFKENMINSALAQMIHTKSESTLRNKPIEGELLKEMNLAKSSFDFWVNFFNSEQNKLDEIFQIVIFGDLCPYTNKPPIFCAKYKRFIETGIFTLHYNIHTLIDRIYEEYMSASKSEKDVAEIVGSQNWMDLAMAFDLERNVLSWMIGQLQNRFLQNFESQFSILRTNILICVLITIFSLLFFWYTMYIRMLDEYYKLRCIISLIPFDIMTKNKILISFLKNLSKDSVRALGKV